MQALISMPELIDHLKKEGLVLVKESEYIKESLKERYLKKKSLTYKDISDAGIWGDIGKKAVEVIAKKSLEDHEKFLKGNVFRIHISAVVRIGKNRGTI